MLSFVPHPFPLANHINFTEKPAPCVDHGVVPEFKATLTDIFVKELVPKPIVTG